MLRKLTKTYKPSSIAAVFECAGPTLREQEFADYKANRAEMPPDLGEQIPYIRRIIEAMRIPILEYPGFEADDVIGTITRRAEEAGTEVVIVSSDKDMLQLVSARASMLNPMKDDLWFDEAKVQEFMGVKPSQVADLLALKGDSIDNIPGAPGIGDKGARDLIEKFGSVEAALERAAEVERKTYRESLQNHRGGQTEINAEIHSSHDPYVVFCRATGSRFRTPSIRCWRPASGRWVCSASASRRAPTICARARS